MGAYAQDLPPIKTYAPIDYEGENQNWAITQDSKGTLHIANHTSLLSFDGEQWKKHASPSGGILRSIAAHDSIIYTGGYMEFGFWSPNDKGGFNYESLSNTLADKILEDEQIWNIQRFDETIFFQSLKRLYAYHLPSKKTTFVPLLSTKAKLFSINDTIYIQQHKKGLYKFTLNKLTLISDALPFKEKSLIGLFQRNKELLAVFDDASFYTVNTQNQCLPWLYPSINSLQDISVYCALQLSDQTLILGTISNGIYQLSIDGKLLRKINQQNGLQDNTVLSAFEDINNNLWLGHDNGISVINLNSPFSEYIDKLGTLGVVYTSLLHNNTLYLGTNQGLFYTDDAGEFKLIKNTKGQVWSLQLIDGTLFCGHNSGTFIIKDTTATLISDGTGTWVLKQMPNSPNTLIQGTYSGLSVLKKNDTKWQFSHTIDGFTISSRFLEYVNPNILVVNHEQKGLFKLKFNADLTRTKIISNEPTKGHGASLAKFNNQLLYGTNNGIFEVTENSTVLDTILSKPYLNSGETISSILIPDTDKNRLWFFTNLGIRFSSLNALGNGLQSTLIPLPIFLQNNLGVAGFENSAHLIDNTYYLGASDGYVVLNLDKLTATEHTINITSATMELLNAPPKELSLNKTSIFTHTENNIRFNYSVPEYDKFTDVRYQYQLTGFMDDWSPLTTVAHTTFKNLSFGEYTFKVRALVANTLTKNTESYSFTILRPWYLSYLALTLYFIGLLLLLYSIHKMNKYYYKKEQDNIIKENKRKLKRKEIKAQKKIIQINNEKLQQEVAGKNRELAVSTMSIIKKNEFLNAIKNQLKEAKSPAQIKSVIKTIDRNINNEDDWKFFEEAFNNADKDFLKKLKEQHETLTPNDLKLCAYLRLNLASKEIAPLLNISVRSVEVKRYRLRKKLNLLHEISLTDYIMTF